MRIGIISDVHGNYEALTAVLKELENERVDVILNAGDNIGYSAFPNECVTLLAEENVISVKGNYDDAEFLHNLFLGCGKGTDEISRIRYNSLKWTLERISDETKRYLSSLPADYKLETGYGTALMFHAGFGDFTQWITEGDSDLLENITCRSDARLVIMGHTHKPFAREVDGTIFLNPGSVGRPFDGDPRASFSIVDYEDDIRVSLRRISYDIEKNIRDLMTAGLPAEIGTMLRNGRVNHLA